MGKTPGSYMGLMLSAGLSVFLAGNERSFGKNGAFRYDAITEPIVGASFSVDVAALTAHRYVGASEVNFARLLDLESGLGSLDLSDDLFGVTAWPAAADVEQGVVETGWLTAEIDASWYPALTDGNVGLHALLTDTNDAMFAIDCFILEIETASLTVTSYYGWPTGNENNGFGLGGALPDGGDLPAALPGDLPVGSTWTGFDETISSKVVLVPEPAFVPLLGFAVMLLPPHSNRNKY